MSVREVTWSKQNGWHPHCHELVFFSHEIDADAYAEVIRQRWQKCAEREGLSMNEHGFRFDRTYGAVADYVAKFGREPNRNPWGAATELAKSHLKCGRGNEHLTPFAMLELISQGHDDLKPIFREYAQWFKGKHQLVWSAGLRSRFLDCAGEELPSQEAQLPEDNGFLLGQLDSNQWSIVLKKEARGQLLEVARSDDWQDVVVFLAHLSAERRPVTFLLGQVTTKVSKGYNQAENPTQPIQQNRQMLPDQPKHVTDAHRDSFHRKWLGNKKHKEMESIVWYRWGDWDHAAFLSRRSSFPMCVRQPSFPSTYPGLQLPCRFAPPFSFRRLGCPAALVGDLQPWASAIPQIHMVAPAPDLAHANDLYAAYPAISTYAYALAYVVLAWYMREKSFTDLFGYFADRTYQ